MNSVETFQENRRKPIYWHILAKQGPKIWPTVAIFHTHTHASTHTHTHTNTHENTHIEKLEGKKSKFYLHDFLGNIVVHIQAKYREHRMRTRGAYSIWTKVDGQKDGRRAVRHRISSADYVTSGAKMGENTDTVIWQNPKPIPRVLLGGMSYMIGHY